MFARSIISLRQPSALCTPHHPKRSIRWHQPRTQCRKYANTTTAQPVLLREYLQDSLYNRTRGYFSTKAQLFSPPDPQQLPFNDMESAKDYYKYLSKLHKENPGAWKTPSSIFGPLYCNAIAEYIVQQHSSSNTPLRIFEIGPGNGVCARSILGLLREKYPSVYSDVLYECIDISPKFSKLLKKSLTADFGAKVLVHNIDFLEWATPIKDPCFIIGLEVLDNLPHDRVTITDKGWFETRVVERKNKIEFDPAIKMYLSITKCVKTHHKEVFVPTGSLFMMQTIARCFPNAHIVFSDFEYFPDEGPPSDTAKTKNVPTVHAVVDGTSVVFESILAAPKYIADIYFPTDFKDLKILYEAITHKKARVVGNSKFISKYQSAEEIAKAETKSGFNPLLQDYENTKFLIS